MILPSFAYVRPKSIKEAIQHLSSEGARIHAGGTDLLGCLRDDIFGAKKLVGLSQLKDLGGIRLARGVGLRIGALTTITEVANHKMIQESYPALARAASEAASPQLRNQGTVGGNICQKPRCWYYRGEFHCLRKGGDRCYAYNGENQYHCLFGSGGICYIVHPSDTAPALVAYEAVIQVAGPKGMRRIPAGKFHVLPSEDVRKETVLRPNEMVTEIILPPPAKGLRSSYRKVRARRSWDFALAGVALALKFKGDVVEKARVVLSGAAPIPWRSREVEESITGKRLDAETVAKASEAALKNAEPLERNGYKIPLFRGMIEEELLAIAMG
ncbi:MAG: xanthine dehydrogenase family protein subunit M [Thermodesulfobacteriota bacterium]